MDDSLSTQWPSERVTAQWTSERTSAKWRTHPDDVLPLWIAEMDYPLAPPVAEVLHAAIDRSDTGYRWLGDLAHELAGFARRRLGWDLDPSRVLAVGDVLVGMSETIRRMTGAGGSVIITPPVYPPFFSTVSRIVERPLVEVPLQGGGRLDLDGLAAAFARPDVAAFLLCNPHNPTGTIPTRQELTRVAELAREHDVLVIADEVWTPLALPGRRITPYLSLGEELTGPDVALMSASKAFNLAGLKCSQIVGGSDATTRLLRERIPIEVTYSAGHLGVIAATAAFRDGDEWLDDTLNRIQAQALLLRDLLGRELPAVEYSLPESTYLAWLDCRALGLDGDPAAVFLERGRVAFNSGADFGSQGKGFVRLNLATSPEVLGEAVRRMRQTAES